MLRGLLESIPAAARGLGRIGSELREEVGGRARSAEDARRRRPDRRALEERSREARMELEEFDRRRRERAAASQNRWLEQERREERREEGSESERRRK